MERARRPRVDGLQEETEHAGPSSQGSSFNSYGSANQFNAPDGTINNSTGPGNHLTGSTFNGPVYFGTKKHFDKDSDGRTPLWQAAANGDEAVVRPVLPNMASQKRKPLNSSSDELTTNTVEFLHADGNSIVHVGNSNNHYGLHTDDQCLRDLRPTDTDDDKTRIEHEKGGLLKGSYGWVLKDPNFQKWRQETTERLLWVRGDPGKGKTMLLCGLIDELKNKPEHTLAYFFCQATDSRINNATSVLRGLVYLLAVQDTSLTRHVRSKWNHGGKSTLDPPNGWYALCSIFEDILHDHLKPICLVIDALDECEGSSLPSLLKLIVSTTSKFHHVKWLVSSRNLPNIERELGGDNPIGRLDLSLELKAAIVSDAVASYIDDRVDKLEKLKSDLSVRNRVKEVMRNKANGTFLWAALVFDKLEAEKEEELENNRGILKILNEVPQGLTNLYARMWTQIISLPSTSENLQSCKKILATMFLTYRPLQLQELPLLADLKGNHAEHDTLVRLVRRCGSFLTIQQVKQDTEAVHFVHQSAKDFLTDNRHAFDGLFPFGIGHGHHQLFSRSLTAMDTPVSGLRQNIYGLRDPGALTSETEIPVPDPLAKMQYSCVRWLDHFCEWMSSKQDRGQRNAKDVTAFVQDKYLCWLEALGLCRSVTEGIASIRKLEDLAMRNDWEDLTVLVPDALRFVLANRRGIETAPLQVYVSALLFCPTSSWVRQRFEAMIPEWIKTKPEVQPEWDACLLTLEGHQSGIKHLTFAPDSEIIASSDDGGIIKIWDPYTGTCLNTILGHSPIYGLAFLPGEFGTILASAGSDGGYSIKIWDPSNGSTPRKIFPMHHEAFSAIQFMADGKTAVWADNMGTLSKLDLDTGSLLSTIKLPKEPLGVSPDGQTIVTYTGSEDEDGLQVWDWCTPGTCRLTLDVGRAECNPPVAFSSDSTKLVCEFSDLLQIWDLTTGVWSDELDETFASCLSFSPDGKLVVSGNSDRTINLWDTTSGTEQVFSGHGDFAHAVAFSPDGRLLASGSNDKTVKIWDPTARAQRNSELDVMDIPPELYLSPKRRWIVFESGWGNARIWSSDTNECIFTPANETTALAFSPDDEWLALGIAYSKTIEVRDTKTWNLRFKAQRKGNGFPLLVAVCSTALGLKLALLDNMAIGIMDLGTGTLESTFSTSFPSSYYITFSPNGLWLALGSRTGAEIWDWADGECIWTLNEDPGKISWLPAYDALLHTSCGNFEVQWSTGNYSVEKVRVGDLENKGQVQITEDGEWITVQGRRMLWVPPQYRPRERSTLGGDFVVAGTQSGIVMVDNSDRVVYVQFHVPDIVAKFQELGI